MSESALHRRFERPEHCAYPDGRVILYGVPDRYYNHSCDPNAWERYVDGHPEIVDPFGHG